MMEAKTFESPLADGTAKAQGDPTILKQLASTMVEFDPRFEIMPGTKARPAAARDRPRAGDAADALADQSHLGMGRDRPSRNR